MKDKESLYAVWYNVQDGMCHCDRFSAKVIEAGKDKFYDFDLEQRGFFTIKDRDLLKVMEHQTKRNRTVFCLAKNEELDKAKLAIVKEVDAKIKDLEEKYEKWNKVKAYTAKFQEHKLTNLSGIAKEKIMKLKKLRKDIIRSSFV